MLRLYILAKVDACSASYSADRMNKHFTQVVWRPAYL